MAVLFGLGFGACLILLLLLTVAFDGIGAVLPQKSFGFPCSEALPFVSVVYGDILP